MPTKNLPLPKATNGRSTCQAPFRESLPIGCKQGYGCQWGSCTRELGPKSREIGK